MQGYLLERLGDVQAALAIYCSAADRANRALLSAVERGEVPIQALPMPTQARFMRAGGGAA